MLGVQENLCQHAMHTVVTINLAGSGLSEGPDIINLYLRAACMNLWNFLLAACTDVSIVVGCPGVGKSVEVYAYAMWQAKAVQKRVIYVHTHGDGYSIISTSGWRVSAVSNCWISKRNLTVYYNSLTWPSSKEESTSLFWTDNYSG